MFGVLIESKAGRQRRRGGALLSVLTHGALITGAIVATTRPIVAKPPEPSPTPVTYVKPPLPQPLTPVGVQTNHGTYVPDNTVVVIPPIDVPNTLPPITSGPVIDDPSRLFVGGGPITHDPALAGTTSVADPTAIFSPEAVEKIAVLRSSVRPTYPEVLRTAGIGGRVVVRFVVDTLGLVERETVVVREASHARFENAVRDVLPRMRFTPARLNDHPVRMLVEMPFEFAITR